MRTCCNKLAYKVGNPCLLNIKLQRSRLQQSPSVICTIAKPVELVYPIEMCKTDCLERQDLSRTYLAHHELESVVIKIII